MATILSFEDAMERNKLIEYVSMHEEKRDEIMKKLCEYYEVGNITYATFIRKIIYHKFCHTGLGNPMAGKMKKREELPEKDQKVYDLVLEWSHHRVIVDKYWKEGIRTPKAIQESKEMDKKFADMVNKYLNY